MKLKAFIFMVVMICLVTLWIKFLNSGYNMVDFGSYLLILIISFLLLLIFAIIGIYRVSD